VISNTQQFVPEKLAHLSSVMRGYIDRDEVPGLVTAVCRSDEVHVEAFGVQDLESKTPMRRDSIFRIASVSKPITAAAAMILVEQGKFKLDDAIFKWLPELQNMRVLRSIEANIDDTVPAKRPITVRDLLTFQMGLGFIVAEPGTYPIQQALAEAGLMPGPIPPQVTADQWLSNLASMPLAYQPGDRWLYHTGSDVLGVLIARVANTTLEYFLTERLFHPLDMKDTSFYVPPEKMDRFATSYFPDPEKKLVVFDPARGGNWSSPPPFQSGGAGLVSTADDLLSFGRMMRDKGEYGGKRILQSETVNAMLTDQLTPGQKAISNLYPGFWDTRGWGLGMAIFTTADAFSQVPGRFGWDGGLGTSWCSHPAEDLVGILLTQKGWTSPVPPPVCADFWRSTYEAIRGHS